MLFCVAVMAGEVLAGTTAKTWQNPSLKIDKKRKRVTVKTLSEFCNEMTLKYGYVPESLDVFYVPGTVSIPQNNAITIHGQNVTYYFLQKIIREITERLRNTK